MASVVRLARLGQIFPRKPLKKWWLDDRDFVSPTRGGINTVHIADGAIRARAFPGEPGWVTLQVQDTGPGVDPQIRNRLFEVVSTTKSGGVSVSSSLSGSRRGLTTGRSLSSAADPRGSMFRFRLSSYSRDPAQT